MKALAVAWAFNELDFVPWTITHLLSQGISIQLFDNWSDDGTYELAEYVASTRKGPNDAECTVERWPAEREECSSLTSRLKYLEELSLKSDYDWIINHDVDEIRRTRTGERMIDFIARMDAAGYNAINHSIEVYAPREGWDGSQNPEEFFTTRVPGHNDERSPHIKAFKKQPAIEFYFPFGGELVQARGLNLWVCGGHQPIFPDGPCGRSSICRLAPEKLLLKHYPLRTQAHAERKIAERKRSYTTEELARGWHNQYREEWWKNGDKDKIKDQV